MIIIVYTESLKNENGTPSINSYVLNNKPCYNSIIRFLSQKQVTQIIYKEILPKRKIPKRFFLKRKYDELDVFLTIIHRQGCLLVRKNKTRHMNKTAICFYALIMGNGPNKYAKNWALLFMNKSYNYRNKFLNY